MRLLYSLILASSLTIAGVASDIDQKKMKAIDASFSNTYKKYQRALDDAERPWEIYELAKASYTLGKAKYGPENINTANLARNYVKAFLKTNKRSANNPISEFLAAVPILENKHGLSSPDTMDIWTDLGSLYILKKRTRDARILYNKLFKTVDLVYGEQSAIKASLLVDVATTYASFNPNKTTMISARKYLKEAKNIYLLDEKRHQMNIAYIDFWYGKIYSSLNSPSKAASSMANAVEIFDELRPNDAITLTSHAFMVEFLEKLGKRDEATKHCQIIGRAKPLAPDQEYLPVYKARPTYPRSAAQSRAGGWVTLEFTVNENGFVIDPIVLENAGPKAFIPASIEAIEKSRFAPQFKNGKAISVDGVRQRYTYRMGK